MLALYESGHYDNCREAIDTPIGNSARMVLDPHDVDLAEIAKIVDDSMRKR